MQEECTELSCTGICGDPRHPCVQLITQYIPLFNSFPVKTIMAMGKCRMETGAKVGLIRLSFRPVMLFCDVYVLCTDRRRRT